jgi:hypothetical protein
MYICNMRNKNFKILQKHIKLDHQDCQESKNYLILIETIDGKPQRPYMVDMQGYKFFDSTMPPYYVVNQN